MTDKFKRDLRDGELGETQIGLFLIEQGYSIYTNKSLNINKLREYDFIATKKKNNIKFEVKTDRWEFFNYPTGNIIIETSCSGTPSGVFTSKSDFYVYFLPDQEIAYFIKTNELRNWLVRNKERLMPFYSSMGDGLRSWGFTLPRKNLEKLKFVNKLEIKIK